MVASQMEKSVKMSDMKTMEPEVPVVEKKKCKRTAYITGFVIAIAIVVLGSTLGAFYFGHVITRSAYKDAKLYYRDDDGHLVKEDVSIKGEQVEIKSSGKFAAIYDYANRQAVFRAYDDVEGDTCYITKLTEDMGSLKDVINMVDEASKSDGIVPMTNKGTEFVLTNTTFTGVVSNDAARKLCDDLPLQMLQVANDLTGKRNLVKRRTRRWRRCRRRGRGGIIIIIIIFVFFC